ncbi:hypothetical protein C8J35_1309 [Rhizobium sp. PP-F2F-G38]|nr:hypothetical protein C8J35_1309 [Rhizobium sp. PP-F2F-G38]
MALADLVAEVVERNGGTVLERKAGRVLASVRPELPSGALGREYRVEVSCEASRLFAREAGTKFLPPWCPERHINLDGTFCLYWEEEEALAFVTLDEVAFWWGKVLIFLSRQGPAERLRRWPGKGDARAHGAEAARAQASAERAAGILGADFVADLRDGRLEGVMSRRGGHRRVRLVRAGSRIASIDVGTGKVLTLRSRCRCAKAVHTRLPLASCGEHAGAFATLALALERWSRAEAEFFAYFARCGRECCGTIDSCPLSETLPARKP